MRAPHCAIHPTAAGQPLRDRRAPHGRQDKAPVESEPTCCGTHHLFILAHRASLLLIVVSPFLSCFPLSTIIPQHTPYDSLQAATAGLGRLNLDKSSPLPAIEKAAPLPARPTTAAAAQTNDVAVDEAFRAAKLGLSDVLFYLLSRGAVPFDAVKQGDTKRGIFCVVDYCDGTPLR